MSQKLQVSYSLRSCGSSQDIQRTGFHSSLNTGAGADRIVETGKIPEIHGWKHRRRRLEGSQKGDMKKELVGTEGGNQVDILGGIWQGTGTSAGFACRTSWRMFKEPRT